MKEIIISLISVGPYSVITLLIFLFLLFITLLSDGLNPEASAIKIKKIVLVSIFWPLVIPIYLYVFKTIIKKPKKA